MLQRASPRRKSGGPADPDSLVALRAFLPLPFLPGKFCRLARTREFSPPTPVSPSCRTARTCVRSWRPAAFGTLFVMATVLEGTQRGSDMATLHRDRSWAMQTVRVVRVILAVRHVRLFVIAMTVFLNCGCFGVLAGAYAFWGATCEVMAASPGEPELSIHYGRGGVAASELDYTYRLAADPSENLYEELVFSSGTRQTLRVCLSHHGNGSDSVSTFVGYTRQDRESTMNGTTEASHDWALYVGGEIARRWGCERAFAFASFAAGLGEIEVLQFLTTPMWPGADAPDMRIRFARLESGVGYRPTPSAELRAGVSVDMMALPHPDGHLNGTILGGENADKTIGAFIGADICWQF